MGLFGRRRDTVIDLTEGYEIERKGLASLKARQGQQNIQSSQATSPTSSRYSSGEGLSFLGGLASATPATTVNEAFDSSLSIEERKKKLARRLMEMTDRIEDLGNQIYHLQQRVDLIERKSSIGNSDMFN
ncbi:MAG TPA: hypothetical protein VJH92_05410 [Candidatus Nanoarchaeia archaeon]|nr:hypothetical protein [Candidatus Nanoarchaeia archaeon]